MTGTETKRLDDCIIKQVIECGASAAEVAVLMYLLELITDSNQNQNNIES